MEDGYSCLKASYLPFRTLVIERKVTRSMILWREMEGLCPCFYSSHVLSRRSSPPCLCPQSMFPVAHSWRLIASVEHQTLREEAVYVLNAENCISPGSDAYRYRAPYSHDPKMYKELPGSILQPLIQNPNTIV